ncbi:MAG: AMP-binding protein [Acidimicrobiales bacterium]
MEPPTSTDPLLALVRSRSHERGDAPYLLDARSARVVSYEQISERVDQHRRTLRSWGLASGERVGLVIADPLTFAEWYLAVISLGAWAAPLDPTPAAVASSSARASALGVRFVVSDRPRPVGNATNWIEMNSPMLLHGDGPDEEHPRRGGLLLSASGTTGAPKVMALGVEQLLATAKLIATHHRFAVADRGFNPLPLWHVNAEVVGLLATLVAGSSLVLDERFHRTGFWKLVNELDVTWINAVPAIISRLASVDEGETATARIRFIRSASAPLAPSLFERFEAEVGVPIVQSYGMTEAASQICVSPIDEVRKAGSVGRPAGVEVRVLADESEVGPIEIRGPTVITRYESPGYEDRFDADGWLRTGDLGYFDDDGYLFIMGRDDDVINRGGEKIYPLEIEEILATVDGVVRVAVVARDDEVFGHVPVAFVQPRAELLTSAGELASLAGRVREKAGELLSPARRPTSVSVVETLPTHATGKIQNASLRRGDVTVIYEERL